MDRANGKIRWYVVQTKPTAEDNVEIHLKKAKFETFLPKIKSMIRGRKMSSRIKSLFPSYLFIKVDLDDANIHRMIRYTRGVRRVLGDGAAPVSVPEEMINIIRERVGKDGVIEQRITLKKGDEVRIRTGPFKDLIGILEKPVSASGRVRVLLAMLKHRIKCDISAADVEKLL